MLVRADVEPLSNCSLLELGQYRCCPTDANAIVSRFYILVIDINLQVSADINLF